MPTFLHGKNTRVLITNSLDFTNTDETYDWVTIAPPTDGSNRLEIINATCALVPGLVFGTYYSSGTGNFVLSSQFMLDHYGNATDNSCVILSIDGNWITVSSTVDAATAAANGVDLTMPINIQVTSYSTDDYANAAASFDVSKFFNDASVSTSTEPQETTTFQSDGAKTYIAGIRDGSLTLSGFYDGTPGGIDAILNQVMNFQGNRTPYSQAYGYNTGGANAYGQAQGIVVFPDGNTHNCFMARGIQTKYDLKSSVSGVVTVDAEVQATGGIRRGWGEYTTFSTPDGSPTEYFVDLPVAMTTTTRGGLFIGGVTALLNIPGFIAAGNFEPNVQFGLQHSLDGVTWVDDLLLYSMDWTGQNWYQGIAGVVATSPDAEYYQQNAYIGGGVTYTPPAWVLNPVVYPYVRLHFTIENYDGNGNAAPAAVNFYFGFARY